MILDQFKLDGKAAVITGASSGIGRAMAGFLAEAGAQVVLVARREDELRAAAEQINAIQGVASYVVADLGQREQPDECRYIEQFLRGEESDAQQRPCREGEGRSANRSQQRDAAPDASRERDLIRSDLNRRL